MLNSMSPLFEWKETDIQRGEGPAQGCMAICVQLPAWGSGHSPGQHQAAGQAHGPHSGRCALGITHL